MSVNGVLYVHTMNSIFPSCTMYSSIISRATHIEYKIAIGHCYSYSSVNIYFQWPQLQECCDFENPLGTVEEWSFTHKMNKFWSLNIFRFLLGVFDERDWLVCGNEPGPSGGQIIIIVIVQFNWQKDTEKSFL